MSVYVSVCYVALAVAEEPQYVVHSVPAFCFYVAGVQVSLFYHILFKESPPFSVLACYDW